MNKNESVLSTSGSKLSIYALLVSAYFFSYFFRVSASVSLPIVSAEWGMSASLVGFISSLYFYAYAFMQPISGALNDRFGPLRIVSFGMLTSGIGALLFGFAANPVMLGTGRLLTGLGLAPMLSGVLVFQSHSFHRDKYSFFSGITYTLGNFGAVISVAPLAFALDRFGRRNVFILLAVLNFVLAASLIILRRRDPVTTAGNTTERSSFIDNLKDSFRKIFKSRRLKLMLILWGTSFGSLMALQGLWAVTWYQSAYGVSYGTASLWSTLISIGVMVGNFAGAYIARPARLRLTAIIVSCVSYGAAWIVFWLSMKSQLPIPVPGIVGFFLGFCAGVTYDHLTAGVNDLAMKGRGGSLFGGMNLFTFISVIIFQSGTGFLVQRFSSSGGAEAQIRAFNSTFGIVTLLVIISLVALPFLKSFSEQRGDVL
ncbi:MFS transporter [Mesotoga sp.]|uniref:MFS transporter n=3 Tax=Mesotoga sp. TaxID=2053577 RepID=UPI002602D637|nr:MFS transporter [Mesotoga sp.]MDD4826591.1 MFS transporter [Mesotoga sp.]MDD5683824.1 MFS transporter [Mesotoga sp.]